jgi:hypothetical protein
MKTNSCLATILALGLTFPGILCADNIDYAATGSQLGTIDLQTGAFTPIGTMNGILGTNTQDLALLPGGLFYGSNGNSDLVLIDPVSLTPSLVGVCGHNIEGLALRQDGILFGCSSDALYQINPNTGAASLVGAMGINSGYYDIKLDSSGHLYYAGTANLVEFSTLYQVNTSTGQAVQIGQSGAIGFSILGLDFANGTLFGFTSGSQIVSINTTTGVGTFVANETAASPILTAAPAVVLVVNTNLLTPWPDATNLGNGWMNSSWFGIFNVTDYPWIYHAQHGWMYVFGSDPTSIWLWTPDTIVPWTGFVWTSQSVYPWLWSDTQQTWLYYSVGSSAPRYFYNWKTQKWVTVNP